MFKTVKAGLQNFIDLFVITGVLITLANADGIDNILEGSNTLHKNIVYGLLAFVLILSIESIIYNATYSIKSIVKYVRYRQEVKRLDRDVEKGEGD